MPLYEYQCTQCGERVEIIQRVSEAPVPECGKCGAEMKKLMSAPAIQFKGSGFYKTDYASGSTSSSSSTTTAAPAAAKSESGSSSESKSTADAAPKSASNE